MRVAGMADIHGKLSHQCPEVDVLCITGDFVPLISTAEKWMSHLEQEWLERKGMRWLSRQKARRIYVSPGNHDLCMRDPATREDVRKFLESDRRIKVLDERCPSDVFEGATFAGFPWTPTIQNRDWAFSLQRSSPNWEHALDLLPTDTDVLIAHGPPLGLLDSVGSRREGSSHLMRWMLTHGPRLTLCGHIHEQRGKRLRYFDVAGNQRKIVNVSICDENYREAGAKVQVVDL